MEKYKRLKINFIFYEIFVYDQKTTQLIIVHWWLLPPIVFHYLTARSLSIFQNIYKVLRKYTLSLFLCPYTRNIYFTKTNQIIFICKEQIMLSSVNFYIITRVIYSLYYYYLKLLIHISKQITNSYVIFELRRLIRFLIAIFPWGFIQGILQKITVLSYKFIFFL